MIAEFQRQSSKNMGMVEDTILRLSESLPSELLSKHGPARKIAKGLNISKIPGLVALPETERGKFDKEILNMTNIDNILFKEDFLSADALFAAIEEKVQKERVNSPLMWSPMIQDMIIAGLFGMTYLPTASFPKKTIKGTTEALFILTEDQAKVYSNQNVPENWIIGPAGTGKTWMLLISLQRTFQLFVAQATGKRRILVLTYNKAIRAFIEDSAEKLTNWRKSKERCTIECFTVDGLKTHLKEKMLGKATSVIEKKQDETRAELWNEKFAVIDQNEFSEVFNTYHGIVTKTTFSKNFGYDAIFVDEAQDIDHKATELQKRAISDKCTSEQKFFSTAHDGGNRNDGGEGVVQRRRRKIVCVQMDRPII